MRALTNGLLSLLAVALASCAGVKGEDEEMHAKVRSVLAQGTGQSIEYCNQRRLVTRRWLVSAEAASLLEQAADTDMEDLIKHLLDIGVPADLHRGGDPASAVAVHWNNEELLALLLSRGADPNIIWKVHDQFDSLLNVAYRETATACVPLLIRAGANQMPDTHAMDRARKEEWLAQMKVKIKTAPDGPNVSVRARCFGATR